MLMQYLEIHINEIKFQIQYRIPTMIKQRKDFPTSLKYKFHVLSTKFPESFKQPINLKPLNEKINNKISIEYKDEDDQLQLSNLSISGIEEKVNKNDSNEKEIYENASQISSKSDVKNLISNIKERSSKTNIKSSLFTSKLPKAEQIVQEEQIKNMSSQLSVNKSDDKLQPETKQQQEMPKQKEKQKDHEKQKEKLDLLKDDSDDEQEINRRRQEKIMKSRGRGNKSNMNISNQSIQQKNIDKSKQNINQNIDKSESISISQIQSKLYDNKMPPKSISQQMDNKLQKMPESVTESKKSNSPKEQEEKQKQGVLVIESERDCSKKITENVEEKLVNEENISVDEGSQLNQSKNQSQNDAEIQISEHQDVNIANQLYKNPLVLRFLTQYEKEKGRSWNQQASISFINQAKRRKSKVYDQSQCGQQEKQQYAIESEQDKKQKTKIVEMQQKLQKMQKNYEQIWEKLSKLDALSAIQQKMNKLQIENNILSSENRQLKIQINSLKDRLAGYEDKHKKIQQKVVTLQSSIEAKTAGLTNQLINLGNNLFERESYNSQITSRKKSK